MRTSEEDREYYLKGSVVRIPASTLFILIDNPMHTTSLDRCSSD